MEKRFESAATDKAERYGQFLKYIGLLLCKEDAGISVLANAAAALRDAFGFFWVGFYLVEGEGLVLGPFQGSPACTRISKGRGVCGTAWAEARSIVVPDVDLFPGHIACSSLSRSEIVVPLFDAGGEVTAVLDIDSDLPAAFDETDFLYLEAVAEIIAKNLRQPLIVG